MRRTLTAALVMLAATAAWAGGVKYDYLEETEFSGYQTFAWKTSERGTPNPLAAHRISGSLERGFEARGYSLAPSKDDADFLIDFDAAVEQSLRVDETWWGLRRRHGWVRDVEVTTYPVGTLAVVVIDSGSQEVVWRGTVSGAVTENRTKMQKRIDNAVTKLLKKFPPPK